MKVKAVQQLCKAKRLICLSEDRHGVQWLSDGCAVYPLYSMPKFDEKNIFTIFDIPKDKQSAYEAKINNNMWLYVNGEDTIENETIIEAFETMLTVRGRHLKVLKGTAGAILIDAKYLAPFNDSKEGIAFYERLCPDGTPYIAVKEGLLLVGIIMPITPLTGDCLQEIIDITKLSVLTAENRGSDGGSKMLSFFDEKPEENE